MTQEIDTVKTQLAEGIKREETLTASYQQLQSQYTRLEQIVQQQGKEAETHNKELELQGKDLKSRCEQADIRNNELQSRLTAVEGFFDRG